MIGFVIIKQEYLGGYVGIDLTSPNNLAAWDSLDTWNKKFPERQLQLGVDSRIYKGDNVVAVIDYYQWINENDGESDLKLYFFKSTENTFKYLPSKFNFIGYDCVYVEDKYEETILFSSIHNELYSKQNENLFQAFYKSINDYGLFEKLEFADKYIKVRQEGISLKFYNLETAYLELNLEPVEVFLYTDSI